MDLRHVPPTGPASRVTRDDVESFAVRGKVSAPIIHMPASDVSVHHAVTVVPQAPPASAKRPEIAAPQRVIGDQRVPLRGMRKRIYENMARSKHTAAHFTYVDECDVGALKALRERTRSFAERDGVKLTFLSTTPRVRSSSRAATTSESPRRPRPDSSFRWCAAPID